MGKVSAISASTFTAYGSIQDITKKDRKIHEMGLAVPGNRKAFFKPSYRSINDTIKEGDIITDRASYKWKVVQIIGERYVTTTEIFKVMIIKSMNLEGSG